MSPASSRTDAERAFHAYTERLVDAVRADERILGVVLLGSGADPGRIDEWSDHDIALVARPEAVEELRASVEWLPDADRIVVVGREWHDGFKALFDDGRIVEYAVTDPAGMRTFPLTAADVVLDRGGVWEAVAEGRASTTTRAVSEPDGLAAAFLVELLVGWGRMQRGERLSGGNVIRSEAAQSLLDLWLAVGADPQQPPDPFDGRRRIEAVAPDFAARLEDAVGRRAEDAARSLLSLAEQSVAVVWPAWPTRAAEVVRRRMH